MKWYNEIIPHRFSDPWLTTKCDYYTVLILCSYQRQSWALVGTCILGRLLAVLLPGLFVQNYELSSSAKADLIFFSAQWSKSSISTFTSFFIFFSLKFVLQEHFNAFISFPQLVKLLIPGMHNWEVSYYTHGIRSFMNHSNVRKMFV